MTLAGGWILNSSQTTAVIDGVSRPMASYTHSDDAAATLKVITIPEADATSPHSVVLGSTGPDTFTGGAGADFMDGGTGNDSLSGLAGKDIMLGDTGNDIMLGGTGNDIMLGGTGDDILNGGTGSDVFYGDTGRDTFKWSPAETGNDFIIDFSKGAAATDDVLDLTDLLDGESANATSLDAYLDFSANAAGETVITVDANAAASGGTGQTITLVNITFASWQAYAGGSSDTAIIAKLLADGNLITGP